MIIRAKGLVKEFTKPVRQAGPLAGLRSLFSRQVTRTRAVDGVSFAIENGEMVGYLGPNGAGKSTTIKMLTGIVVPTAGTVEVNGQVPWRDRSRNARNIGVVFGQRTQLWYDLPLRASFELIRKLYGIDKSDYFKRLSFFNELLDLEEFLDTPVRSLSLGQRMRGDLIAAVLHSPPLLYLDEPTIGLDVVAKAKIREFITNINTESGTTVVLTTHDIADVEHLCRRVILIDHGRVLYDGDIPSLRRRYVPYRDLVVTIAGPDIVAPLGTKIVRLDPGRAGRGPREVSLRFDPSLRSTPAVVADLTARHEVLDLSIIDPDLEAVIAEIYSSGSVKQ